MKAGITKPLKFANAEACLSLTKLALCKTDKDREFLDTAMKCYAKLVMEEANGNGEIQKGS